MNVLIFEPGSGGHRYVYVRHILRALSGMGAKVTIATIREGLEAPEYEHMLRPLEGTFALDPCMGEILIAGRGRRGLTELAATYLAELPRAVRRHKAEYVYLPTADGIGQTAGLLRLRGKRLLPRGAEAEVCIHRGNFAYRAHSLRRRLSDRAGLAALAAAPWARVHFVDLLAYEWLTQRGGSLARRSALLPDPVDAVPPVDKRTARQALGLPEDGRLVALTGGGDQRKRTDLLIDAFLAARLGVTDRLLLAGLREDWLRERLRTQYADAVRSGRLIVLDRFMSDAEFLLAIQAADVIATTYPRQQGISAVCLRATAAGRPVLAADFGWMDRIVRGFGLGWTCSVENPESYRRGIEAAVDGAARVARPGTADRLLDFHSPDNFAACWTARLREKMGLAPLPGRIDWESVRSNA